MLLVLAHIFPRKICASWKRVVKALLGILIQHPVRQIMSRRIVCDPILQRFKPANPSRKSPTSILEVSLRGPVPGAAIQSADNEQPFPGLRYTVVGCVQN